MRVRVKAVVTIELDVTVDDADSVEEAEERVRQTSFNTSDWEDHDHRCHVAECEVDGSVVS